MPQPHTTQEPHKLFRYSHINEYKTAKADKHRSDQQERILLWLYGYWLLLVYSIQQMRSHNAEISITKTFFHLLENMHIEMYREYNEVLHPNGGKDAEF